MFDDYTKAERKGIYIIGSVLLILAAVQLFFVII